MVSVMTIPIDADVVRPVEAVAESLTQTWQGCH